MADVKPFRAVLYDEQSAGPLADLVAPPYDVVSPAERAAYLSRSPYNVVHLTLPDDEATAALRWTDWQREGILVRDEEPAVWALSQDYVGPDGVARTRNGLVASLRVEPYERRVVLPHERTHQGPKEGRLRLLRAVRAQLEPIFLLHDGPARALPERAPDLEIEGARLWRVDESALKGFAERQLLIADGHHRYETALAFHQEEGTEVSAWLMVVLVSTREKGLTIFPTHRTFAATPQGWGGFAREVNDVESALDEAGRIGGWVAYERNRVAVVTHGQQFDAEAVDGLGHDGIAYTPVLGDALQAVDSGAVAAAALVRAPRIEDVWEVARRGETLPQKTTYFYPKLVSGLLFHPL